MVSPLREVNLNLLHSAIANIGMSYRPEGEAHAQTTGELDDATPAYIYESCDEAPYKWNCDEIRSKINALIRSGQVKVTHFQKDNDINSNSYGRFMKLKGPYSGIDNQTYDQAHRFFRRREDRGVKTPAPKKATATDCAKFDVSGVVLAGETLEEVPVFDDCNEVRRKINAHLKEPGITQASFCRAIAQCFADDEKNIQGKQLAAFLKKKGESSGAESSVYYGAYVFFEKLRIKNGTKKGKKRQENESRHPGGRPLRDISRQWVTTYVGGARRGR